MPSLESWAFLLFAKKDTAMTTLTTLNIATRQSPLALWQAEHIQLATMQAGFGEWQYLKWLT